MTIEVINAAHAPVPVAFLRSVLDRAARLPEVAARLPEGRSTVAVRLTNDDELRRLHRDFGADDTVTDVLSFEGTAPHIGDLAISWPAVQRQAELHRHPTLTELGLLCVHGFLHLLGWDHSTLAEHREMSRMTVAALGLSDLELAPGRL